MHLAPQLNSLLANGRVKTDHHNRPMVIAYLCRAGFIEPKQSRSLLNHNPLNDKNMTTNHCIPLPNSLVTDLDVARRDG